MDSRGSRGHSARANSLFGTRWNPAVVSSAAGNSPRVARRITSRSAKSASGGISAPAGIVAYCAAGSKGNTPRTRAPALASCSRPTGEVRTERQVARQRHGGEGGGDKGERVFRSGPFDERQAELRRCLGVRPRRGETQEKHQREYECRDVAARRVAKLHGGLLAVWEHRPLRCRSGRPRQLLRSYHRGDRRERRVRREPRPAETPECPARPPVPVNDALNSIAAGRAIPRTIRIRH